MVVWQRLEDGESFSFCTGSFNKELTCGNRFREGGNVRDILGAMRAIVEELLMGKWI